MKILLPLLFILVSCGQPEHWANVQNYMKTIKGNLKHLEKLEIPAFQGTTIGFHELKEILGVKSFDFELNVEAQADDEALLQISYNESDDGRDRWGITLFCLQEGTTDVDYILTLTDTQNGESERTTAKGTVECKKNIGS